ncbi:MAG: FHA domain-containing protein [Gaiellales bacterium]
MSYVYCADCGFQNPEVANYCQRCGAFLHRDPDENTLSLAPEDVDDDGADIHVISGAALVIRSGGGRAGDTFERIRGTTLIGRSPDCDVFLDDVTVSRRHAEIVEHDGAFAIRDLGSLNGTFVNRRRIEDAQLADDDEVQVGKYRMTFLLR